MTDAELEKALDTHKYYIWVIEREQIRRMHGNEGCDNTSPIKDEDTSPQLKTG